VHIMNYNSSYSNLLDGSHVARHTIKIANYFVTLFNPSVRDTQ
jgi:hypothetical protein